MVEENENKNTRLLACWVIVISLIIAVTFWIVFNYWKSAMVLTDWDNWTIITWEVTP